MALGGGAEKIRLAGTGGEDRGAMFAVAASMRDLNSPQLGLCGTWVRLQIGASNVGVELFLFWSLCKAGGRQGSVEQP